VIVGAALGHAVARIDDVAHLDLYSCFPCAVEMAAAELGLDLEADPRPPTVTGGLTFAGGPASNYPMHSLAALTGRLREDAVGLGLATGVGWFMTKHATAILSASAPARPFADFDVQDEVDALPRRAVADDGIAATAPVESYTASTGPALRSTHKLPPWPTRRSSTTPMARSRGSRSTGPTD
jgi:acetyl-CoA C-acetyltransferase